LAGTYHIARRNPGLFAHLMIFIRVTSEFAV